MPPVAFSLPQDSHLYNAIQNSPPGPEDYPMRFPSLTHENSQTRNPIPNAYLSVGKINQLKIEYINFRQDSRNLFWDISALDHLVEMCSTLQGQDAHR
jgi:hypothetical protein